LKKLEKNQKYIYQLSLRHARLVLVVGCLTFKEKTMNKNPLAMSFPIGQESQLSENSPSGMPEQAGAKVTYVRELTLKYRGPKRPADLDAILSPEKAAAFMRQVLPDNVREHFLTLFLNSANRVVGYFVAATGTANSCQVGAREVFQAAVVGGAVAIVVGHNHTSGETTPSLEDRVVTKRLREAGELLGIPMLDHLIIGIDHHFSFRESGQMEP
jgi:DNA repair protein RadC